MADNPFMEIPDETNPFMDLPDAVDSPPPKSEQAAAQLQNLPIWGSPLAVKAPGPGVPPSGVGGAAVTAATGLAGLTASGYAGLAGTVAGMVPGGESPNEKGNRYAAATREAIIVPPANEASERILGGLDTAGKAFTAIPSAIGTMPQLEPDNRYNQQENTDRINAGLEKYQQVQEIGPSRAAGEKVLDITGSPLAATVTETAPAALGGLIGVRSPVSRSTPDMPDTSIPGVSGRGNASVGQPRMDSPVDFTPISSEKIVADLRAGKTASVADAVYPDLQTVESARRLGIDLNPEHYSTNTAFQDVARALKTRPGSELQKVEVAALAELNARAEKLITESGGKLDRGAFSDEVFIDMKTSIDELTVKSRAAYKRVNDNIPPDTLIDPGAIQGFLEQRLRELGGDRSLLNALESKVSSLIRKDPETGEIIPPTYAALDRVRKDIGLGYKRKGPFAELGDYDLNEVYALLSDVQGNAALAFGDDIGALYAAAKDLTAQRKALENNQVAMFGKQVTGSLVPKIRTSANALVGGDVSKFKELMNTLPEARRAEAAANVLGEVIAGGTRKGAPVGQGFASSWRALNQNKVAKDLLFSYLPNEARRTFDDIGRVVTGIIDSTRKPLGNPSGSAGPIVKALDDLSFVQKLYQGGKKVVVSEGATTAAGIPGVGAASSLTAIFMQSRKPMIVAADELLASPQFSRAIKKAIDGDIAAANQILENSSAFKKWATTITEQDAANIAKVGFIAWMTEDNQ